jgi:hypothetical protein
MLIAKGEWILRKIVESGRASDVLTATISCHDRALADLIAEPDQRH